ncbi:MAG: hypothetical protein NTZ33_09940, partial [Bacteroidetes bacterium]|nr:hypothetical protein [Bacteroidota bacterium]
INQLGNQQVWLDWIDRFGMEFQSADNLSDKDKKQLINSVIKDILVTYDHSNKLHLLSLNFRLPILCSLDSLLSKNVTVIKRFKNTPKVLLTTENTDAPNSPLSGLLNSN